MRANLVIAALLVAFCAKAEALDLTDDLSVTGYGDLRVIAPTDQQTWLKGGLGKFRYGSAQNIGGEGVAQADWAMAPDWSAVSVLRAEPEDRNVVDALETYLRYAPAGEGDISYSVKAGAFFPAISMENDDLGWASPYTLTPSAINSWIGDELRTIGSEGTVRWKADLGTVSLLGAVLCCNDEAGIVMADRGWSMDDRPSGLFERIRLPTATEALFHAPSSYARTGLFDEIDGRPGWYGGASWQADGVGKISVIRYDNEGNPAARSSRDSGWDTRFWSVGARSGVGPLTLIAQALRGQTNIAGPGFVSATHFQSAFLLASYDVDDWRVSAREDVFATRRVAATNNLWNEDGDAFTAAVSWSGFDWLRLTGEVVTMNSRRGEYVSAGLGLNRNDTQVQFDSRFFF
jgi:hypothetical protein